MIKEIIIPIIEHEVNTGKNFAPLCQVVNSMILATWYKKALKESLLGKAYVDQGKVDGVVTDEKNGKLNIYNQYLEAFKRGVSETIKEEYDPALQEVVTRKYVSGGFGYRGEVKRATALDGLPSEVRARVRGDLAALSKRGVEEVRSVLKQTIDSAMLVEFSAEEQRSFDQAVRHIQTILPSGNKQEDKKEYQNLIANELQNLTRGGKLLFPKKTADQIAKKRKLLERLDFLKELALLKESPTKFIFSSEQLLKIIRNISIEKRMDIKNGIDWLISIYEISTQQPLFNGYQISQIIRKFHDWNRKTFELFNQLFEGAGLSLNGVLAWTLYKNKRLNLVRESWKKPFKKWSTEAIKLKSSLTTNSTFELTHALKLGQIIFSDQEFIDYENAIKKSMEEEQKLLDELKINLVVDDLTIKQLIVSFNPQIRSEVMGIVYKVLSNTIVDLVRQYGDDVTEVLYRYLERYDWTRTNAGLKNLQRNLYIIGRYHREYLFWDGLSDPIKKILKVVRYLKKKRFDRNQIKEVLLSRGYTNAEIAVGFNFHEISLDAPVSSRDDRTLYDVIDAGTVDDDEIAFEDVGEGAEHEVVVEIFGVNEFVQAATVGEA